MRHDMKNIIIIYQPLFCCYMIVLVCPENTPPKLSYTEERFLWRQNASGIQVANVRQRNFRDRQSHPSFTKHEGSRYINGRLY